MESTVRSGAPNRVDCRNDNSRLISFSFLAFGGLDLSNCFDHGIGQGALGTGVTGRVVVRLGNVNGLDLAIDRVDRVTLAASIQSSSLGRSGMGQLHIEGFGEVALRIAHELQQGQTGFLVLGPSLHYGSIIDTIDNDFFDPFLSKRLLLFEVVWDLFCGSGGGKCTGQTDQQDRFVLGKVGQVVFLGRKSEVEFHAWQLISYGGQPTNRDVSRHRSSRETLSENKKRHGEWKYCNNNNQQ